MRDPKIRAAILKLKEEIKKLSDFQHKDKARRKGCPQADQSDLWVKIFHRAHKITATINFYHLLKGRGDLMIRPSYDLYVKIATEALTKEYCAELELAMKAPF